MNVRTDRQTERQTDRRNSQIPRICGARPNKAHFVPLTHPRKVQYIYIYIKYIIYKTIDECMYVCVYTLNVMLS